MDVCVYEGIGRGGRGASDKAIKGVGKEGTGTRDRSGHDDDVLARLSSRLLEYQAQVQWC